MDISRTEYHLDMSRAVKANGMPSNSQQKSIGKPEVDIPSRMPVPPPLQVQGTGSGSAVIGYSEQHLLYTAMQTKMAKVAYNDKFALEEVTEECRLVYVTNAKSLIGVNGFILSHKFDTILTVNT